MRSSAVNRGSARNAVQALVLERAAGPHVPRERTPQRRGHDHAERRRTRFHQCYVHRVLVAAGDELAGAVEWIDQEEAPRHFGHAPCRHRLLRDHRHARCHRAQPLEDDRLGGLVRHRDRRGIGLGRDVEAGGADPEDFPAGDDRSIEHVVQ